MSYVTNAVRNALGQHNIVTAGSDVKRLVCDELALADPTAQIQTTDYFNHTYVPDIVLDWDNQEQREVYLRFVSAPERFLADVERIGSDGPIVFDLSLSVQPEDGRAQLTTMPLAVREARERSPQLLMTDGEATRHVRPKDTKNMVERLVVSNLMRSGRGRLDESTAKSTVAVSRAGYYGAIGAEPDDVKAAATVARQMLDPETERRVKRTLQLLWWVGGSDPQEFPIGVSDDMELNPSDTRDFLRDVFDDEHVIDDDAFWSRLADRLSFDTLVNVGDVAHSDNLHRLMKQLVGRLKLSHVTLDRCKPKLPLFGKYNWSLENNFLCLCGPSWECRFTPHGNRFSKRKDIGQPIDLVEAGLRSAAYRIEEVQIDEAAREVVLSRKAADPAQQLGGSLQDLAAGFADDAAVRTIAVFLGDSLLTADFDRMMVGAQPDATVRQLATFSTKILVGLDHDDEAELATLLGS